MSSGLIDLRPGRGGKRPPAGQTSLFIPRSPQAPKKPMPLRARRRRLRAAFVFGILVVIALLAWGIHYVSYLPQISIRTVAVTGTQNIAPQLVNDYVETLLDDGSYHFLSRKNIFLYPRAVIARDVVAYFPRIASASVSRPSLTSTTLSVSVVERQSFALWCADSSRCYQMDKSGFIFAEAPSGSASSTQYVFQGGIATSSNPIGETFVSAHLPALIALLDGLSQSGFPATGASLQNDTDFSIPLQNGYFIKVSFGENPDTVVKNLQLALSSDALQGKTGQLEYIDLRFGDRVYFKLKGEAEATSTSQ